MKTNYKNGMLCYNSLCLFNEDNRCNNTLNNKNKKCMVMVSPETKVEHNKKQKTTFKLPHPNMIEMDEIKNSLSRKEPLLFLEYNKRVYVYVHKSILWKADILNIPNTLPRSFEKNLLPLKNKWVQYVKKVKLAKWKKSKQETKVQMIFPKI